MEQKEILNLLSILKSKGSEIPYIEAKDSLVDRDKIGETLSALSNSASYNDQKYGYMIWGLEDKTWDIVGTSFDLMTATQKKKGLIYPQINHAFNYKPEILTQEFFINGNRLFVARIKNCGNQSLYFAKIAYIRNGEANGKLMDYPLISKAISNKSVDWSGIVPDGSSLDWIDQKAFGYIRSKFFEISENKKKQLNDAQLLNALSLIDSGNKPNNTCLLFIGDPIIAKKVFEDRNKITWIYRDELNGIEDRLSVDDENLPLIFGIQNILNKINKFNTTLQDLDLFRNDVFQYDAKVIEEMIVNAVVHRDWNINLWIEVVQTPISLEIRNPGKFRADLNMVLLENKRPEYLNPNLADFAKAMHLMEKEGGGLKKSYVAQSRKGLSINHRFDNESDTPRVDFILSGKVKDVAFASFMFISKNLSQDQVVILDKINSGRNILHKDVSDDEYELVKSFVTKRGQGGISLKINEHLLRKSKKYMDDFSSTHASQRTSREMILDYAKKNTEFTTAEIYDVMNGKSKEWVRKLLMRMVEDEDLKRVSKGIYSIVVPEQPKQKITTNQTVNTNKSGRNG